LVKIKTNADKVADVSNALPNTLTATNWMNTYNSAAKIPSTWTNITFTTMQTNANKVNEVGSSLPIAQ
jgi:hypothetical protein